MSKIFEYLRKIRHTPKGILVLCIFLIGFILRGPMAAVAPIVHELESAYQIDQATVGWLSGIPVFCYAAFSPLASYLIGKRGLERTFIISIVGGSVAVIMRSLPYGGFYIMFFATVLMGASVALGNIAIPLIAARDFPKRFALITGLASATMNLGNVFAFAFTVPLANIFGFRVALLLWLVIDLVVLLFWVIYIFRKKRGKSRSAFYKQGIDWKERKKLLKAERVALDKSSEAYITSRNSANITVVEAKPSRKIHKLPFTYFAICVFTCQCVGFFGLSAWLPSIFQSLGYTPSFAGTASSLFQLLGIVGSVAVSFMLPKLNFFKSYVIIGGFWILLPYGLLFIPQLWYIWIVLAGFAQGANYILMFTKIADYSRTQRETRKLSAATQMTAYFAAGVTPSILGAIYGVCLSWNVILVIISAIMTIMLISGLIMYKKY